MLSGAMLWGQVVATFCNVVSSLQATDMRFRETLDHLNDFMASESLPPALQWRLREFFFRTKHLRVATENTRLIQIMSPGLQAETLALTSRRWLRNVRFLHGCDPEFIASLVLSLKPTVFTPDDLIMPGYRELFVIHRGVALFGGKLLQAGHVWGEDVLLECEALRSRNCAKALTYLETNSVGRETIFRIAERFPLSLARLRRYVGFLALHRQVVVLAKIERALREEQGLPPHGRSSALERFFRNADEDQATYEKIRWLGQNPVDRKSSATNQALSGGAAADAAGPAAALSLTVLKKVGRTPELSAFYAEAAGAPAVVVGSPGGSGKPTAAAAGCGGGSGGSGGSGSNGRAARGAANGAAAGVAAAVGRGRGVVSPSPEQLGMGAPDKARPFAPRPVREPDAPSAGFREPRKQWQSDTDDEVPRAGATTSSFSVRPGSYAAEAIRAVEGAPDRSSPPPVELASRVHAAFGEAGANGASGVSGGVSGAGHSNGNGPRLRKNKLQAVRAAGASVDELRAELRTALQAQQQSIEGLFARLRDDLQQAGALPARAPPSQSPGDAVYEA